LGKSVRQAAIPCDIEGIGRGQRVVAQAAAGMAAGQQLAAVVVVDVVMVMVVVVVAAETGESV